ncbi:MAG: oligoendopeptidase F [Defluviitaleaceae bacterium]|nr:oligoendopeptidase F [Defluviitaleaceae bacterium]
MEIKQKQRHEIAEEYKWKLEDLYATADDWRRECDLLEGKIEALQDFKGELNSGQAIFDCLEADMALCELVERAYMYANLKQSENTALAESQAMAEIAEGIYSDYEEASAFIAPEILQNSEEALRNFIKTTSGLGIYEHYINNLLRQKPHTLSIEMEELLASAGEMSQAAANAFEFLNDADLKYGTIIDEDGNEVELTDGRAGTFLCSKDRRVRKDAYEKTMAAYAAHINTIASLRNSDIKKDIFFAKARNHKSTLDAALFDSNIPKEVYENLISTVHEFLPVVHRYNALRKRVLGLDEYQPYDSDVPLVDGIELKIPYDKAREMVAEALAPLGDEYLRIMCDGMNGGGWIDVYETEGKTSGGFQWSAPRNHPYILLNYADNYEDMFTLAHELGHAMHHHYADSNQPLVYADYTTFSAEIASTVNETIMIEYMLKKAEDKNTKIHILTEYIHQFTYTVFCQVMFAEFEMLTHRMAEEGEPFTPESIGEVYLDLRNKYEGPALEVHEYTAMGWSDVPHFFEAFYVYQYATGYAAAIAFAKRIKSGDPQMLADYLDFLKAGSSGYTIDILKKAGVDMSSPAPIREALEVFENLVAELESLI